jgi:hypothetical protein
MFSLGRTDIWPSGDLAVRVGFGDLMGFDERLSIKDTDNLAIPFAPYRSALALLCWRYYGQARHRQTTDGSGKKSPAKKGPANKDPTKKVSTKKVSTKKAPAKKAPVKKAPAKSNRVSTK